MKPVRGKGAIAGGVRPRNASGKSGTMEANTKDDDDDIGLLERVLKDSPKLKVRITFIV